MYSTDAVWRPRRACLRCTLDAPGGPTHAPCWHDWDKPEAHETSFYAEYGCTGPGAATVGRVEWAHLLSAEQAAAYTFEKVMDQGEGQAWDPFDNR